MICCFRRASWEAAPHHWGEVEPLKCKMLKCESTALLTIVDTIQYNTKPLNYEYVISKLNFWEG